MLYRGQWVHLVGSGQDFYYGRGSLIARGVITPRNCTVSFKRPTHSATNNALGRPRRVASFMAHMHISNPSPALLPQQRPCRALPCHVEHAIASRMRKLGPESRDRAIRVLAWHARVAAGSRAWRPLATHPPSAPPSSTSPHHPLHRSLNPVAQPQPQPQPQPQRSAAALPNASTSRRYTSDSHAEDDRSHVERSIARRRLILAAQPLHFSYGGAGHPGLMRSRRTCSRDARLNGATIGGGRRGRRDACTHACVRGRREMACTCVVGARARCVSWLERAMLSCLWLCGGRRVARGCELICR